MTTTTPGKKTTKTFNVLIEEFRDQFEHFNDFFNKNAIELFRDIKHVL